MKKISTLLTSLLLSLPLMAQKDEIIKTGWNFGPLPVVGFELRLFVITPNWKIEKLGLLLDFCMNCLTNMTIPVGVKTHAMSIIDRIAETEPEIRDEVLLVVEEIFPYLSTGGKNRAGKMIKKYKSTSR